MSARGPISLQNGKLVKGAFDSDTWYLPSTDIVTGLTHTWEGQSKLAADLTAIVGAGNADDILDGALLIPWLSQCIGDSPLACLSPSCCGS